MGGEAFPLMNSQADADRMMGQGVDSGNDLLGAALLMGAKWYRLTA
jgi:hypothetical protein